MNPVAAYLIAYFVALGLVLGCYVIIAWRSGEDRS